MNISLLTAPLTISPLYLLALGFLLFVVWRKYRAEKRHTEVLRSELTLATDKLNYRFDFNFFEDLTAQANVALKESYGCAYNAERYLVSSNAAMHPLLAKRLIENSGAVLRDFLC